MTTNDSAGGAHLAAGAAGGRHFRIRAKLVDRSVSPPEPPERRCWYSSVIRESDPDGERRAFAEVEHLVERAGVPPEERQWIDWSVVADDAW